MCLNQIHELKHVQLSLHSSYAGDRSESASEIGQDRTSFRSSALPFGPVAEYPGWFVHMSPSRRMYCVHHRPDQSFIHSRPTVLARCPVTILRHLRVVSCNHNSLSLYFQLAVMRNLSCALSNTCLRCALSTRSHHSESMNDSSFSFLISLSTRRSSCKTISDQKPQQS